VSLLGWRSLQWGNHEPYPVGGNFEIICPVFGFADENRQVTDTEIKATYCLAVTAAQWETIKANDIQAGAAGPGLAKRHVRFRDYLLAKGFLIGNDPPGVGIAMRRGAEDVAQCNRESQAPSVQSCRERCNKQAEHLLGSEQGAMRWVKCLGECPSPNSSVPLAGCLESFLPF
jgi:hypothetical protein